MTVLPHVTAVGTSRTIGTTGNLVETGKTSGTTTIRAEIKLIGEIWTIMVVSIIQVGTIQVAESKALVVHGLTSTTVLQVGERGRDD